MYYSYTVYQLRPYFFEKKRINRDRVNTLICKVTEAVEDPEKQGLAHANTSICRNAPLIAEY